MFHVVKIYEIKLQIFYKSKPRPACFSMVDFYHKHINVEANDAYKIAVANIRTVQWSAPSDNATRHEMPPSDTVLE
jgi:hypothetical protein